MQHGLQRNRDGSHAPPSHLPPTICAFGVAACSSKPRALSKCGCACSVPASSAAFGCAIKASTLPPAAWATCEGAWHRVCDESRLRPRAQAEEGSGRTQVAVQGTVQTLGSAPALRAAGSANARLAAAQTSVGVLTRAEMSVAA